MTAFDKRFVGFAKSAGFTVPLLEDQLMIAAVRFHKENGEPHSGFLAADANQKSRMWLEQLVLTASTGVEHGVYETWVEWSAALHASWVITPDMRREAKAFFGRKIWAESSELIHPFVNGFKTAARFDIVNKVEARNAVLARLIESAWERRDKISADTAGEMLYSCVYSVMDGLNTGDIRSATERDGIWTANQFVKQAILLFFRIQPNEYWEAARGPNWDKVPLKCGDWDYNNYETAGFRMVPGSVVREGCHIAKGVILMPSFVNIGAFVDEGTMVDTWATVGSCAQIGKNCHLSGGVGIGGVLEPLQANPTVIEDGCFIGARSEVVEGVIVRRRAVLSMGVFIGKNTPIVDRTDGNRIVRGEVPEGAVVMMGMHPENGLICPQIVKYRDEKTDAATALNDALR